MGRRSCDDRELGHAGASLGTPPVSGNYLKLEEARKDSPSGL
jgi:hypothetical protein